MTFVMTEVVISYQTAAHHIVQHKRTLLNILFLQRSSDTTHKIIHEQEFASEYLIRLTAGHQTLLF